MCVAIDGKVRESYAADLFKKMLQSDPSQSMTSTEVEKLKSPRMANHKCQASRLLTDRRS